MGYVRGLEALGYAVQVTGVDHLPQPRYPFRFVQGDALEYLHDTARKFELIHSSPPCQRYSKITKRHGRQAEHPDLVAPTRQLLQASDVPYVIENVEGAPLVSPTVLCGSMFGLRVRRHRLFETSLPIGATPACDHEGQGRVVGVYGNPGGSSSRDGLKFAGAGEWRAAMGIDWMTAKELREAIPPAYTSFIAQHFAP